MDAFTYLSVLYSIILGLAIAQLLQGLGRVIQYRQRVRLYWPSLTWVGLLVVIDVQAWWATFGRRSYSNWNFLFFLVVLIQPIGLYLVSALVLPEFSGEGPVDLRENYYGHSHWFFGIAALIIVSSYLKNLALDGHIPLDLDSVIQLVFLVVIVAAAITKREWFHKAVAPFFAIGLGVYISVLFARLR
jgi:hypothetical protein